MNGALKTEAAPTEALASEWRPQYDPTCMWGDRDAGTRWL
jgi:hypothetical protein